MIINSLTLENFKSHKNSHVDFDKGINLILGENGAGKSTIFEAISYAFFKEFTGRIDDIKRQSEDEKDIVKQMKVTVEFEHDAKHYKLERGKKSSAFAHLYSLENNKFSKLISGDSQVTDEIRRILELDSKSFLNAVYIRQGDITDLIEKTAGEKKELIGKLLNIDSVQKAYDEINHIIQIYEGKENENKGKLERSNEVESGIEELNQGIKEEENTLNELSSEITDLKSNVAKLKEDVSKSDENKNIYNSKYSTLTQQEKIINSYKEQLEKIGTKLKNIEDSEKEIKNLEIYKEKLPHLEKFKDLKRDLNLKEEKLKDVNEQITQVNKNKQTLKDNEKYYKEYDEIKKEIEELNENRRNLEEEVKKNQEISFNLNNAEKRKEDNLNYIRETSGYASKLFGKNFSSPEEVENKVKEEIEKCEYNLELLIKKINDNNEDISVKKNLLKNTKKSLQELEKTKDTCPICQSPITHEKHSELSDKYHQDIISCELRIEELTDANKKQKEKIESEEQYLNNIKFIDLSLLSEKYNEFNNLRLEIDELKKLIPKIEEDDEKLQNLDNDIKSKTEYLNQIENKRQEYILAKKTLENLRNFEELTKEKEELQESFDNIKLRCRNMMVKFAIKDDIETTLKFTKKQVDKYNELRGFIQDKDNVIKEKEDTNKNLTFEESNLIKINNEIKNLNYNDEENKKLHETYTSEENKLKEKEIEYETCRVNNLKDKEQLEKYQKELSNLKEISKEQTHLKDYITLLNEIKEYYSKDGVQKILRQQAKPDIEKATIDIFNEFDFEYSSLRLDENYDVTIETKDGDRELKLMSGGEKIVIALALRLGIAQVVSKNKTELLLLDEPTIHLDEERRASLIDTINTISIVPQMIVVTHDDEMEPIANKIIKVVKNDGISSIDY